MLMKSGGAVLGDFTIFGLTIKLLLKKSIQGQGSAY
jgi:hypothetical protein